MALVRIPGGRYGRRMKKLVVVSCVLLAACGGSRKAAQSVTIDPETVVYIEHIVDGVPVTGGAQAAAAGSAAQASAQSSSAAGSASSANTTGGNSNRKSSADNLVEDGEIPLPETKRDEPGRTVAGLGDPGKPGMWLQTPLVSSARSGKVVMVRTGKTAQVSLLPLDGPATGGSQLSLEAYKKLGAPLTQLVELDVYPGG